MTAPPPFALEIVKLNGYHDFDCKKDKIEGTLKLDKRYANSNKTKLGIALLDLYENKPHEGYTIKSNDNRQFDSNNEAKLDVNLITRKTRTVIKDEILEGLIGEKHPTAQKPFKMDENTIKDANHNILIRGKLVVTDWRDKVKAKKKRIMSGGRLRFTVYEEGDPMQFVQAQAIYPIYNVLKPEIIRLNFLKDSHENHITASAGGGDEVWIIIDQLDKNETCVNVHFEANGWSHTQMEPVARNVLVSCLVPKYKDGNIRVGNRVEATIRLSLIAYPSNLSKPMVFYYIPGNRSPDDNLKRMADKSIDPDFGRHLLETRKRQRVNDYPVNTLEMQHFAATAESKDILAADPSISTPKEKVESHNAEREVSASQTIPFKDRDEMDPAAVRFTSESSGLSEQESPSKIETSQPMFSMDQVVPQHLTNHFVKTQQTTSDPSILRQIQNTPNMSQQPERPQPFNLVPLESGNNLLNCNKETSYPQNVFPVLPSDCNVIADTNIAFPNQRTVFETQVTNGSEDYARILPTMQQNQEGGDVNSLTSNYLKPFNHGTPENNQAPASQQLQKNKIEETPSFLKIYEEVKTIGTAKNDQQEQNSFGNLLAESICLLDNDQDIDFQMQAKN